MERKCARPIGSLLAFALVVPGCSHGAAQAEDPQRPSRMNSHGSIASDTPDAAVEGPFGEETVALVRDTDAAFQTDRLRYTVASTPSGGINARMSYVFTNPTPGPVYFVNCKGNTPPLLQKRVDDHWVNVWAPTILDCLSPPIVVPPGEEYRNSVSILAAGPDNNLASKLTADSIPGIYRFVWHDVLSSYDGSYPFGEPLPLEQRISNRFYLHAE